MMDVALVGDARVRKRSNINGTNRSNNDRRQNPTLPTLDHNKQGAPQRARSAANLDDKGAHFFLVAGVEHLIHEHRLQGGAGGVRHTLLRIGKLRDRPLVQNAVAKVAQDLGDGPSHDQKPLHAKLFDGWQVKID